MSQDSKIVFGVIVIIACALGLRIWWVWPEQLPGGRFLYFIERRGNDYTLNIKAGVPVDWIVDTTIFEGYSPDLHFEYQEKIDNSNRPSKHIKGGASHYYIEYITEYGRIQFHTEWAEGGGNEWFEFLPANLTVDQFFEKEILMSFDLERDEFKVYIPNTNTGNYMSVSVKNRQISEIVWLGYY